MYCVNGESGSSLLIESTDAMIYISLNPSGSGSKGKEEEEEEEHRISEGEQTTEGEARRGGSSSVRGEEHCEWSRQC